MSAPSLLTLPPELVHQTLLHLLPPHSTPRQTRRLLSPLLSIHPTLTPVVRKLLCNKVGFVVGDPERNEVKLLGLLEREHREETKGGGRGQGSGIWVRVMKIRCPEPGPGGKLAGDSGEEEEEDPAAALLPRPRVSQVDTLERVTRLVKATKGTLELGGPGICPSLFSSIFSSPSPPPPSSTSITSPASTLRSLTLTYLTSIPLPLLITTLSSSSELINLETLKLYTGFPFSRQLTWNERRSVAEMRWLPLAASSSLADHNMDAEGEEEEEEAWEEVVEVVRGINKLKGAEGEVGRKRRVRLWKNRYEVPYTDHNRGSDGLSSEDEGEGDEEEEDPNALFEPDLELIRRDREMDAQLLFENGNGEVGLGRRGSEDSNATGSSGF
ncbi:hypothetical protein JCM11641_005497 [Rhodosporidiobolus odoratus]